MKELWLWRGVAAVAVVAFLASSWSPSVHSPTVTRRAPEGAEARPMQPNPTAPRPRRAFPAPDMLDSAPPRPRIEAAATMPDGTPIPPEVLEVAREQVRAEDRARREARSEQHYDELLDTVDTFSDDHKLEPAQRQALADAVTAMHERIRALREAPPTEGGAGFGDHHEGYRAAFEQLDQDVRAAVGDDLADEFHEVARPPGHGGPPDGGDGPPDRFNRQR